MHSPNAALAEVAAELAPRGTLRAAINLLNFLLVSSRGPNGEPQGVAPDMARAIAERLGVALELVPYDTPGELADAVVNNAWDIGLIGAEPARTTAKGREACGLVRFLVRWIPACRHGPGWPPG